MNHTRIEKSIENMKNVEEKERCQKKTGRQTVAARRKFGYLGGLPRLGQVNLGGAKILESTANNARIEQRASTLFLRRSRRRLNCITYSVWNAAS